MHCKRCNTEKPIRDFYPGGGTRGRSYLCRPCFLARPKPRYHSAKGIGNTPGVAPCSPERQRKLDEELERTYLQPVSCQDCQAEFDAMVFYQANKKYWCPDCVQARVQVQLQARQEGKTLCRKP